ncbi:hypothetical protein R1sor_026050 [Riccia sorocarpa]|uniref:Uncharacterized protein n=1 Tax=Riccia sorocarpa TaxID=122646 RepID=A0ABD3GD34_9MARC
MTENGLIPTLIHYLWRTDRETTPCLQLLHEISKVDAGRNALLASGLEKKALMTISRQAANGTSEESRSLAEKVLQNLCQESTSVAIKVAQYQVSRPLISMMSPGVSLDIRAEMARAVIELQSNDNGYALLIKAGVISPLLDLLQNGRENEERVAAARALHSLSASESNRVDLCHAGAIPALVKFIPASDHDLRLAIMGALANLATDHQAVTEMDQEGAVSRLLGMLQLVDAPVHDFALKTLQCMSQTSKTVRLSLKEHDVVPYFLTLLENQSFSVSCRASTLSLILHLVEDGDSRQCVVLSANDVDMLLRFLDQCDCQSDEHESVLGILAGMSEVGGANLELQSDKVVLTLVKFLEGGHSERCHEYAAAALSNLVEPGNPGVVQKQLLIAKNGGIPLLVRLLKEGSVRARCSSAVVLGRLSLSTPKLTKSISLAKRFVSLAGVRRYQRCKVHAGKCTVKDTMCLVESGAAGSLMLLLGQTELQSAEKALEALATLVADEESSARGVDFLVKRGVIAKLIGVLGKSDGLTDKAAKMIARILRDRRYRDERSYWQKAQNPLCLVVATGTGEARKSAALSLELLGLVPKGSTYTR